MNILLTTTLIAIVAYFILASLAQYLEYKAEVAAPTPGGTSLANPRTGMGVLTRFVHRSFSFVFVFFLCFLILWFAFSGLISLTYNSFADPVMLIL